MRHALLKLRHPPCCNTQTKERLFRLAKKHDRDAYEHTGHPPLKVRRGFTGCGRQGGLQEQQLEEALCA